jgi:PKD repeat protein
MKNLLRIIILSTLFCSNLNAQDDIMLRANKIIEKRGEICFSFLANKNDVNNLSKIISIDKFDGTKAIAYANKKEFEEFLKFDIEFSIIENSANTKALTMATSISQMSDWDRYPTYDVYVEMMQKFATDYPDICKLDTIGYSVKKRLLLAIKISDNVHEEEAEPEVFYSAQMHGDELVCGVLFLRFINYLLTEYPTNSEVKNLVDNLQIYINPFANPDGTYRYGDSSVANAIRYNANFVDLNRNFPYMEGNNDEPEPEVKAMMNFASKHNFVLAANSHSGAEVINYPFDDVKDLPADVKWWEFICREYATNAQNNSPSGYFTDIDNGVTNGYDWYSISGSRQDYMNYFHNCREVTLELSTTKMVDASTLPDFWRYNRQALMDYTAQSIYGLRGIVTDSITGEPLVAKVFIEDHDYLNSHVFSNSKHGDYYRLLYGGNYRVSFSVDGYISKIFDVDIENYKQTTLNVQLVRTDYLLANADFDFEINDNIVTFFNKSINFDNLVWDFADRTTSEEENPIHTYSEIGKYNVKLKVYNSNNSDEVTKEISITNLSSNNIEENVLDVYPNPTTGTVRIKSNSIIEAVTIKDISGKTLLTLPNIGHDIDLDMTTLIPGIYLFNIIKQEKTINVKIIKK